MQSYKKDQLVFGGKTPTSMGLNLRVALSLLGIYMKRFGWSRPALLIGYFLAPRLEPKLYQAWQVYGWTFFERPIVIVLVILTLLSIWAAWKFSPNTGKVYAEAGAHGASQKKPQLLFGSVLLGTLRSTTASSIPNSAKPSRCWSQVWPLCCWSQL